MRTPRKVIPVSMPETLHREITTIASEEGYTVSTMMRESVQLVVDDYNKMKSTSDSITSQPTI